MAKIQTEICRLLGIEHPILLAGMGGVSYANICAAVSNAGGFGTLGMAAQSPEFITQQMREVRRLTDKPFGVDLLTAQPETLLNSVDIIINEGARAFIAGLGIPVSILEKLKKAGVLVMSMCGSVAHACKAEAAGVDVIIAQGTEGGGHTGRVASLALWPQVVDRVRIPVIAAGGLYDGRGLAAALALGCQGVWMGTRFIASHEAHAAQVYKEAIVSMRDEDTTISRGFTGKPLRAITNDTTRYFEANPHEVKAFPNQLFESIKANRLGPVYGTIEGVDPARQCLAAGQSGGGITHILSCADIIAQTMAQAQACIARLSTLSA